MSDVLYVACCVCGMSAALPEGNPSEVYVCPDCKRARATVRATSDRTRVELLEARVAELEAALSLIVVPVSDDVPPDYPLVVHAAGIKKPDFKAADMRFAAAVLASSDSSDGKQDGE
jgi:hypothetical protein